MATAAFALEPLMPSKPQTYNQYPGNTTRMSSRPNKRKNVLFKLGRETTSSPATTQPFIQSVSLDDDESWSCEGPTAKTTVVKPDNVAGLRRTERPSAHDGKLRALTCRRRTFKDALTRTRLVLSQSHP
jgi:hypothetical protein